MTYTFRVPRHHPGIGYLDAKMALDLQSRGCTVEVSEETFTVDIDDWQKCLQVFARLVEFFERSGLNAKLIDWTINE